MGARLRGHDTTLGKRAITAGTDLRLASNFEPSDGFFLCLQTDHELIVRRCQVSDQPKAIGRRAA